MGQRIIIEIGFITIPRKRILVYYTTISEQSQERRIIWIARLLVSDFES